MPGARHAHIRRCVSVCVPGAWREEHIMCMGSRYHGKSVIVRATRQEKREKSQNFSVTMTTVMEFYV